MEPTKPQCHHVMDSGYRCQTPPLKNQDFCHYHRRLHADFILPGHPRYVPPILENRHSIQIAIHHVYVALSKSLLGRKEAGMMLYTLQLAQNNIGKAGIWPSRNSVTDITPPMQQALHLDENLHNTSLDQADENTPRSTDTAPRSTRLCIGINKTFLLSADPDPATALARSNRLHSKEFSPHEPPEFCPELDFEDWQRITRDLPPKGEAGSHQQQANARRVLQVLTRDEQYRRLAGIK